MNAGRAIPLLWCHAAGGVCGLPTAACLLKRDLASVSCTGASLGSGQLHHLQGLQLLRERRVRLKQRWCGRVQFCLTPRPARTTQPQWPLGLTASAWATRGDLLLACLTQRQPELAACSQWDVQTAKLCCTPAHLARPKLRVLLHMRFRGRRRGAALLFSRQHMLCGPLLHKAGVAPVSHATACWRT